MLTSLKEFLRRDLFDIGEDILGPTSECALSPARKRLVNGDFRIPIMSTLKGSAHADQS